MLGRLTTVYWLTGALAGFCLPAYAVNGFSDTSISPTSEERVAYLPRIAIGTAFAAPTALSGMQLAQNDISVSPETASGGEPLPALTILPPPMVPVPRESARIALLLPLRSEALGRAAAVVRNGFLAAYDRELGSNIKVSVLESGDSTPDILAAYNAASIDHDILVGPLSRAGAAAIAQSGQVRKPTVALTQTDGLGDAEILLPNKMLVIGLSVEQEARQVANWAQTSYPNTKPMVITTNTAWQRRAAKAFALQWQQLGMTSEPVEIRLSEGFLHAHALAQLLHRMQTDPPAFLFAALTAEQTRQLRLAIGREVPVYGTSQLNPLALSDWITAEPMPELDGVRLVDLPWQLQADHPAVMTYPRMVLDAGKRRNADLERLYALGIDAYRVTRELVANHTRFVIDGATGKLTVDMDRNADRFERVEVPAAYRDGVVTPLLAIQ